jgi:hypothetical protein
MPVHPLLSGHRASFPKLAATAHESYKLSVPSALQGIQAPSTPTRISNRSPENLNLGFPPNRSKTPREVTLPWLACSSSVHALCSPVSLPLCSPDAPRPIQLSYTASDHREHLCSSVVRTITVDSVIKSVDRAIDRGETIIRC